MAAISGGGFFTASPAKKVNGRAEGATPARKIYLYEGKFANTTGLSPLLAGKGAESQILSFNIDEKKWEVEDHWNNAREDGEAKAASEISRYSRGTAVDIPGQSGGFYIGGARIWEKEDKYEWYYPEDVQLADMDFGGDKVAKKVFLEEFHFVVSMVEGANMSGGISWSPFQLISQRSRP